MNNQGASSSSAPDRERRGRQPERRSANALLHAIFEHAFNGITLVELETGVLTHANPAFLAMTGYAQEDLPDLPIDRLFRSDDWPAITRCIEQIDRGEAASLSMLQLKRSDGSLFHADLNCTPFERDGTRYVLCEYRDLSKEVAAQVAIDDQDARHRRIYDSMHDAFAMVDLSGRIVECNEAFQAMLGYTLDELKQMTYIDLTPAKWHAVERAIIEDQVLPEGQSVVYEKEYIRKDGSVFPVELKTVLLRDKDDQPEMMWAIIRDMTENHRNSALLREGAERFRNLLWNIPSVAVQGYSFDGTTHYWNRASEALYGYTPEEAIGQNLFDLLIPPEMLEGVKTEIEKMVATGEPIPPGELSLMRKDGSRVAVFSSHAIVQTPGGEPELFCIDIDLTQPRQMEAASRQNERRLAMALENSPVAVFEQDLDLRYTWTFNHPRHGYLSSAVLGKTDREILEATCAERLQVAKRAVLASGQPLSLEAGLYKPGRPVEYYDLHIEPWTDERGQIIGLIGAAINITRLTEQQKELSKALAQRQWAEATLREREEQLALFVEYAPASIAMFSRKMNYLAASRRWIQDHGLGDRDIRGYSHYDVVPDLPEQWKAVHQRCLAGAIESSEEDSFVGADGRERSVRWEVRPWRSNNGEIGGIIIFSEDITEIVLKRNELAKAKAEAEQANAAKSQFLAAASHDLRQPLHALDIYLGIIADQVPAAYSEMLGKMRQCSTNLSSLLNELLDLTKLEAGAVIPQVQDFPLADFLDRIANTHAPLAENKDLLFRVARTRLITRTDPQLLQQLVANLVSNAIRYTERGSVLIGVRRYAGSLWIEVWDTGIGIPPDKQKEIFEPFKQLGNPERNREAGTGLGLALVQQLAIRLGLKIRLASRPGHGSMFAVEVPHGGVSSDQPSEACQEQQQGCRQLRVALVEDDAMVREATQFGLTHLGHQVIAAASTDTLLAALGDQPPDLLIADYRLAGHSTGLDSVAALHRRYDREIRAIIITGDTDPAVIEKIRKSGLPVLNKPLLLDELQKVVSDIGHALNSCPHA